MYKNQSNSRMTELLFEKYVKDTWYPEACKEKSKTFCIIIDNCAVLGDALSKRDGKEYPFLPFNVNFLF